MSNDDVMTDRPGETELKMVDSLDVAAPKSVDGREELDAWLESLSDRDLRQILLSRELSEALQSRRLYDLSTVRCKPGLRAVMRDLGIAPATLATALRSTYSGDGEAAQVSNVIQFRLRPSR